jgi:hypothetical protein
LAFGAGFFGGAGTLVVWIGEREPPDTDHQVELTEKASLSE